MAVCWKATGLAFQNNTKYAKIETSSSRNIWKIDSRVWAGFSQLTNGLLGTKWWSLLKNVSSKQQDIWKKILMQHNLRLMKHVSTLFILLLTEFSLGHSQTKFCSTSKASESKIIHQKNWKKWRSTNLTLKGTTSLLMTF